MGQFFCIMGHTILLLLMCKIFCLFCLVFYFFYCVLDIMEEHRRESSLCFLSLKVSSFVLVDIKLQADHIDLGRLIFFFAVVFSLALENDTYSKPWSVFTRSLLHALSPY